ncbi:glycosyltransferase [Rhodococcus sp. IEGM 1381]|uniref:glycosyltransferase n=1 Tax=Rhodococcus sp. IEGM 1381 TaxID=3047085 RepID=UPI0024B83ECF|nr:glycosyltransferase [Rhodococcus sp. IEGM 1381]MDI9896356.1 glycosyltransferase [Rhodococcus sp. IEGM 1381]
MRVLLATYGTRGDVEPMVALAAQLRQSGAQVQLCAPPDAEFASLLERAGVPIVPFARSWRSWQVAETTAREVVPNVADHVNNHIAATFDTVAQAAQDADVVLATGMLHFVAGTAAEVVGIPNRFVVFSPSLLEPQGYQSLVGPAINAHRASLSLPAVDDMRAFLLTRRPWLAADPVLGPPPNAADVGARSGAWILPDNRPLTPEVEAFLDAGDPPVYVGFGSMIVEQDAAMTTIEAIRGHGRRAIVGRGWAGLEVTDNEDCLDVGDSNLQALFPRVACVVHHGGAGTTTTAARAGTPQVVVPQIADQPYWAARVAALGIGVAIDNPSPTLESIRSALAVALTPKTAARAHAVAETITGDGAAQAAQMLYNQID